MAGAFPTVIALFAVTGFEAEAATSMLFPSQGNTGLSPQYIRAAISPNTSSLQRDGSVATQSGDFGSNLYEDDRRINLNRPVGVRPAQYQPPRPHSAEDGKDLLRTDSQHRNFGIGQNEGRGIGIPSANTGFSLGNIKPGTQSVPARLPTRQSTDAAKDDWKGDLSRTGRRDQKQDLNRNFSSEHSISNFASDVRQAKANSTSGNKNTNNSSNTTNSDSILRSIKENAQAIEQPIVKGIAKVGSSQCDNVKSIFGLSYQQLEGETEPDVSTLKLHVRHLKNLVIYNIDDAVDEIPKSLDSSKRLVIFIHGFTDDPSKSSFQNISESFLEKGGYNVIALDGSPLIRWLYLRATTYVRFMGERLGKVLAGLVSMGLNPKDILIVGHSLGAHIAGFTGKTFRKLSGAPLGRISGLDPAGPCFTEVGDELRLNEDDAEFVDVMHTNAGIFGHEDPIGHVDFFVNGGSAQPGCALDSCSHSRSWLYYSESVTDPELFLAIRCKDWRTFEDNMCGYTQSIVMGFGTPSNVRGEYYLQTSADPPYGRDTLVNNVLDRTRDEELNIVGNQLGCRVVELLLPYASAEDLERYMDALFPELRRLCADNFSSHVVEKLLVVSCERATESLQGAEDNEESDAETPKKKIKMDPENAKLKESKYSKEHLEKCYEFTMKVSKYALNNMEDFVFDDYANHILRSAMRCLSGVVRLPGEKPKKNIFKDNTDDKMVPPHVTKIEYKKVPEEFKDIVKEYAQRLSQWPQFKDLPYQSLTSGLLQVLLFAVKNVDKNLTKVILKKLLDESFAPQEDFNVENVKEDKKSAVENGGDEGKEVKAQTLPPVFHSEAAVRLLEAALFVAKKKIYTQIYARCFIGRLSRLATMPMLNYTVQRLFDNCSVKEELEMMFDEVAGECGAVLACGNTGVILSIAKACERLKARQSQFVTAIKSALHCTDPDRHCYLPVLCLRLLPYERIDTSSLGTEYATNIHGALVLQSVLHFQRPTEAVSALLDLSMEELLVILCDAKGCHVADAFFQAPFVGVKSRDKMIWKLKGSYQRLAMSKYGSRAFEAIFEASTPEQKVKIMTELTDKSQILNGTACGRLIAGKLNVELFRVSQDKWKSSLDRVQKNKDIFKDIIEEKAIGISVVFFIRCFMEA